MKNRFTAVIREICAVCLFWSPFTPVIQAQDLSDEKITIQWAEQSLDEVVRQLERKTKLSFAYDAEELQKYTAKAAQYNQTPLEDILKDLLANTPLTVKKQNGFLQIVMQPRGSPTAPSVSGKKYTFSGTVLDKNRQPLIGAVVYIRERETGTYTDEDGVFSMTLPAGSYTVHISYISYTDREEQIVIDRNLRQTYTLSPASEELKEVVITRHDGAAEIKKPQMSMNRISAEQIKQMPVVLGEADPLKSLLMLPGVTNAGEASSGFNVRGGAADQNLILLDGTPIFGDSHMFGFFSIFNADALNELELYKGGIPSGYGGRVSSVLDAHQKTGNYEDFHANGGIGLISSRLLVEGPIEKQKGSFFVAGRSSYAHLFLKLADNDNSAYFYDLNTKLNYRFDKNNRLSLSGYFGRDFFDISDSFVMSFGNALLNLKWNHRFSEKLVSDLSVMLSQYKFGLDINVIDFKWDNAIDSYGLTYDFRHSLSDRFALHYGGSAFYHDFNPGILTPKSELSQINRMELDKRYALEPSLFIDAGHELTKRLSVRYGLRYSLFYRLGRQDINLYENSLPVVYNPDFHVYERGTPVGSTPYGSGETIRSFDNLEPRIGLSYMLNDDTSIKASYNRMAQYLHLIANTQSPTPVNVWTPSGPYIEPQLLDQVALGYFRNFKNGAYSLETEVFYKDIQNRIDYIDGADLIANNEIETVILNGKARAYGWEVLLRKNTGRLTGWVAYTLSRAEQQTPGRTPEEPGINNGDWYLSPYDKLHDLSITGRYELNPKWFIGANFSFQTGQPVTFPNGQYHIDGIVVPSYDSRNKSRLPAYHHLDISATYIPKPEKKKGWQGEWVFSAYNVYSRKNATTIIFEPNRDTGVNEAVRLSIFGIVPSISYNFKF